MAKENGIIKIVTNSLVCILTLILLLVVYNFIQLKMLKKDYTNFFGYAFFEVASGSMEPTIKQNDLVIVKLNNKEYNIDDIITYISGNNYITHRVIDKEGDYFIARGDANNVSDDPIKKTAILGKVVKTIPEFGIWTTILATPKILFLVVLTILLFGFAFSYKAKVQKICTDFGIFRNTIIEEYEEEVESEESSQ